MLAAAISTDWFYSPTICRLPSANVMIDVTQVVLLSVRRELRSEYAELFFDIFRILPHIVPVKVASQSTPDGETTGQL